MNPLVAAALFLSTILVILAAVIHRKFRAASSLIARIGLGFFVLGFFVGPHIINIGVDGRGSVLIWAFVMPLFGIAGLVLGTLVAWLRVRNRGSDPSSPLPDP